MSFASHELRNPLTSIKGIASEILEGDFGEVSPVVKAEIEKIFIRTNDNIQLIQQYLNKSKFELGQIAYQFEILDLKDTVAQIVEGFRYHKEHKKVALLLVTDGGPFTVKADKGKIQEVVGNLVDNAIKYSPENTTVEVSLSHEGEKVVLRVKDNGIGIPKETIPQLFQKFARAQEARKVNIKGSGLGLYLAKQFIEAHKGQIRVESEGEGKGSTFIVELPFDSGFVMKGT
jgi:signal transduction histidine kinase